MEKTLKPSLMSLVPKMKPTSAFSLYHTVNATILMEYYESTKKKMDLSLKMKR